MLFLAQRNFMKAEILFILKIKYMGSLSDSIINKTVYFHWYFISADMHYIYNLYMYLPTYVYI